MFCRDCGTKIEDGNRFCPECGRKVTSAFTQPTTNDSETPVADENKMGDSAEQEQFAQWEDSKKGKSKKVVWAILIVGTVFVTAGICIFLWLFQSGGNKLQEQLDLGKKYLEELDYDQALACYQEAIEIDPQNVDAYLGIVEVYMRQDMLEEALEWAEKGYDLTGDERLKEKIDMIESEKELQKLQEQLDLGQKYLEELDYDQALACYMKVLEMDPENVDAYLGIVEVYVRQNLFEEALEWAKKGYDLTGDERLKEKIDMLEGGEVFDSQGKRLKMSYYDENGVLQWWHQYTYDEKGREATVTHCLANGSEMGTVELEYDEEGNQIVSYGYGSDSGELGKIINTYENGNEVKEEWYTLDGELENYSTFEYGDDGKLEKENHYYRDEGEYELRSFRLYYYDSKGLETKYEDYSEEGKMWHYATYEYDEEGRRTKYLFYAMQYDQNWEEEGFGLDRWEEYVYDENGEWIKTIEYDAEGNVTGTKSI